MSKGKDSAVYLTVGVAALRYVTGRPIEQATVIVGDRVMVPDGRKGTVTVRTFGRKPDHCTVNVDVPKQTAKGQYE